MATVRAGEGHSTATESRTAGREAVEAATADVPDPAVVTVFASSEHDQQALLDGVGSATDAPVVGCTTAGEIVDTGSYTESVAVLALGGDGIDASVGSDEYGETVADAERAGRHAVEAALAGLDGRPVTTNVVSDGGDDDDHGDDDGEWRPYPQVVGTVFADYDVDQQAVMDGITDAVGPATLHGGLAADDWKYDLSARVYHDDTVVERGVAVAALDLDVRTGLAVKHGLETGETRWTVTDIEGDTVREFDGRPALDVYEEAFGAQVTNPQFRITKPLGFDVGDEEPRVFVPYAIDEDERTMSFTNGSLLEAGWTGTVMDPSADAVVAGAEDAIETAMARAGDPDPADVAAVVVHDCLSRWFFLSDAETRERELDAIRERVGPETPIVGWYTAGELSSPDTLACTFDQTMVAWVITTEPL